MEILQIHLGVFRAEISGSDSFLDEVTENRERDRSNHRAAGCGERFTENHDHRVR